MPIQPLAPTLRAKAAALSPRRPLGLNVPASISSLRKARTSWRNSLHSGGSSTGSNWKMLAIISPRSPISRSLRHERPQRVGALRRDHAAQALGPQRLVAEFLAPAPEAARRMVQRVLIGKAHRAMHLVRDRGPRAGRIADPQLGDRHLGGDDVAGDAVLGNGFGRAVGGGAGGGDLAGEVREVLLHRLELGDRPAELHAIQGELHRLLEDALERPGHLLRAGGGGDQIAVAPSKLTVSRGSPERPTPGLIDSPSVSTSATTGWPFRVATTAMCLVSRAYGTCRTRPATQGTSRSSPRGTASRSWRWSRPRGCRSAPASAFPASRATR